LVLEHTGDLTNDFSDREVPFHAKESGQTELAIDGTSYLAGDTDRGPRPAVSFLLFPASIAAIASLAVISLRHPYGFDRFPVPKSHQVTNRAIARDKSFVDSRQTNRISLVG